MAARVGSTRGLSFRLVTAGRDQGLKLVGFWSTEAGEFFSGGGWWRKWLNGGGLLGGAAGLGW